MPEPKIYVPGSGCKKHEFSNGGSILKLGLNVEKVAAFMEENQNDKGWINLILEERKEVGQYGDTHSLRLDTWKPTPQGDAPKPEPVDNMPF